MGRITDQLTELIKRMEESDRRLKELTDQHIADTRKALDELERLAAEGMRGRLTALFFVLQ